MDGINYTLAIVCEERKCTPDGHKTDCVAIGIELKRPDSSIPIDSINVTLKLASFRRTHTLHVEDDDKKVEPFSFSSAVTHYGDKMCT